MVTFCVLRRTPGIRWRTRARPEVSPAPSLIQARHRFVAVLITSLRMSVASRINSALAPTDTSGTMQNSLARLTTDIWSAFRVFGYRYKVDIALCVLTMTAVVRSFLDPCIGLYRGFLYRRDKARALLFARS